MATDNPDYQAKLKAHQHACAVHETALANQRAHRARAGRTYADAAEAFVAAWVELHAHDLAANSQASCAMQPTIPGHAEFMRDTSAVLRDPASRARARLVEIAASLPPHPGPQPQPPAPEPQADPVEQLKARVAGLEAQLRPTKTQEADQ